MINNNSKAAVAVVDFGFAKVEGLMLPDGSYAIAIAQANNILNFSTYQSHAQRTVKALIGKDVELTTCKTELTNNKNVVLTISQFRQVVRELDKRGNKVATAFIDAALEETIERRFDNAFGRVVEEAERNALLALRMKRLLARKAWTDCIRDRYISLHGSKPSPEQYRDWTVKVNLVLFGKPHFQCNRDNMDVQEQHLIETFEFICVRKALQFPLDTPEGILEKTLANF